MICFSQVLTKDKVPDIMKRGARIVAPPHRYGNRLKQCKTLNKPRSEEAEKLATVCSVFKLLDIEVVEQDMKGMVVSGSAQALTGEKAEEVEEHGR